MAKSDEEIYWFSKLYDDTFRSHEWMIILGQGYPLGSDCKALYVTLRTEATKGAGVLRFSQNRPYKLSEIFSMVPLSEEAGKAAWTLLKQMGIVSRGKNGEIALGRCEEMFGSETGLARRLRNHHANQLKKSEVQDGFKRTQCEPSSSLDNPFSLENLKNLESSRALETFWKEYPRKSKPDETLQWFAKHKPEIDEVGGMLIALERDEASPDWQKDGGRWVPSPDVWLDRHPWTDRDVESYQRREYEKAINGHGGTQ